MTYKDDSTIFFLRKSNVLAFSFGPRAFDARSIIGDARNPKMQSLMNLKIKYRESFQPFAVSVLWERLSDYFDLETENPYMLLVAPVLETRRTLMTKEQEALWGIDLLHVPRSDISAITHVDYSARIQRPCIRRPIPAITNYLKPLKPRQDVG